tara:strand:+ start:4652 stop:5413 length:762 start_codon:yes stop_codon:yes gene_type:complete
LNYDVVIHSNEPRYWAFLLGSLILGILLVHFFHRLEEEKKSPMLKRLGVFLFLGNVTLPLYAILDPDQALTWHRSLPLHFCGMNYILIAVNCFARSRFVFLFTAFLGTIGGVHGILTPQLVVGDAPLVLVDYYMRHTAIIFFPIIMARSFGFQFIRFGWMWIYVAAALLSSSIGVFNWVLNTFFAGDVMANYMYMWEAPKADNPFVPKWPWPYYIFALHAGLNANMLAINIVYRWRSPLASMAQLPRWKQLLT